MGIRKVEKKFDNYKVRNSIPMIKALISTFITNSQLTNSRIHIRSQNQTSLSNKDPLSPLAIFQ